MIIIKEQFKRCFYDHVSMINESILKTLNKALTWGVTGQ